MGEVIRSMEDLTKNHAELLSLLRVKFLLRKLEDPNPDPQNPQGCWAWLCAPGTLALELVRGAKQPPDLIGELQDQ